MTFINSSAPRLLHLLLLAELLVQSASRPAPSFSHCSKFRLMIPQVDRLAKFSKRLLSLTEDELKHFSGVENRLDGLPHISHNANYFLRPKVNQSMSQLYVYTQSFKMYVDWLKTAKENVGLSSEAAEGAGKHLLQLSNLIDETLHQINMDVPQPPTPSLPVVSTAFDAVQFSVEISQPLNIFCNWSRRLLLRLQSISRCPKH